MILIKLNNDRHNLHTFIEDIETKVFYILYIQVCILIQGKYPTFIKILYKIQNSL